MANRIVCIGDVHGRSDLLVLLHTRIKDAYGDIPVYLTGDLIDRGPDSKGVIEYSIQNNFKSVIGNHDAWLCRLITKGEFDSFAIHNVMGGKKTIASYGSKLVKYAETTVRDLAVEFSGLVPAHHRDWLGQLPYYRRVQLDSGEIYWILHAGLTNIGADAFYHESADDEDLMDHFNRYERASDLLIWTQPSFPSSVITNGKKKIRGSDKDLNPRDNLYHFENNAVQIFGHCVRKEPIYDSHYIAIDTGCGTKSPEKLTAVILPEKIFISVGDGDLPNLWV